MADNYIDLQIRIFPRRGRRKAYPLEAVLADGRSYLGGELRLDQTALREAALDPREYGRLLQKALFDDSIVEAYHQAIGESDGRVRIRLRIARDAAELHAIRWERLIKIDQQGNAVALAAHSDTPFSRYFRLRLKEDGPLTERPIKMLVVVANPPDLDDYGLVPIDVDVEIDNLRQALGELDRPESPMEVILMPGRAGLTDPELRDTLEGAGYLIDDGPASLTNMLRHLTEAHILHFVGHGAYSRQDADAEGEGGGTAALYLEHDEKDECEPVKDDELVERLIPVEARSRLIFLAACESAKRDGGDGARSNPFVGLGPKLVQAGIPAVVAMQDKIPVSAAQKLVSEFYRRLREHGVLDRALNEARAAIYDPETTDWSTPVLFMRLRTGQLLAANPVRAALENVRDHHDYACYAPETGAYIPLPIEVIHLTRDQLLDGPDQIEHDSTARLDIIPAFEELFKQHKDLSSAAAGSVPQLILLVGAAGSNRATQLKRLMWHTAQASLEPEAERQVLPVFVNLDRYPAVRAEYEPIETLVLEALQIFWPDLTARDFRELLEQGPTLRVLFYGMDDLPDREQRPAWEQIQELIRENPRHDYVLATNMSFVRPRRFEIKKLDLHLLWIQPLAQRKIRHLLDQMAADDDSKRISKLVSKLNQSQLYDLAATPWFLVRMISRARADIYPESRTDVLQRLVEDAITEIPAKRGMRAHAEETVYALAWEMQWARRTTLPVSKAFQTMAQVRGSREYNLEEFYKELTDTILLDRVGEDELRFAYLPIQAYCCAQAIMNMLERERRHEVLDDITATLGRITRLRWWEETLVFLSGLMADRPDDLRDLLIKVTYGVNLLEGGQTFLAARCLLESQQAGKEDDLELIEQVVDALIWRLNREHEPRISHRVRAARLLGQLVYPLACRTWQGVDGEKPEVTRQRDYICSTVVDHLTTVANKKARRDPSGELDYYYSSLRLAAAMALQHLYPELEREVKAIDPRLDEVLHLWQDKKVGDLVGEVESGDEETQAIAVLALGDLYDHAAMGIDTEPRRQIVDCLVETFVDPGTEQVVRWAVADALAIIDSKVVNQEVVLAVLQEQAEGKLDDQGRIRLYKCLAYLIGRIRCQEPDAHHFLTATCLGGQTDVRLWASAIRALGELSDPSHKPLLEQIAVGKLEDVELGKGEPSRDLSSGLPEEEEERRVEESLLRRRAIEALANVGDESTLRELRATQTHLDLELWRTFYQTSEEIYWRLWQRDGGRDGGAAA